MSGGTDSPSAPRLGPALVALAVVAAAALLLVPVVRWAAAHEADQACRNHLRRIGVALLLYRGQAARWPRGSGSDLLIALHGSGVITDPGILLCPASPDRGGVLGPGQGRLPANAASYAGSRDGIRPGPPGRDGARLVVAADDDEGAGARYNHGDHLQLLFLDGHVETHAFDPDRPPRLGEEAPVRGLRN